MAIRHEEEFNPWPSFVDIFSSVILVMLLFLLVVLVNLGYYAQFSHKVSYTGALASTDLILNDNPSESTKESLEEKDTKSIIQKDIKLKKIVEQKEVKAKESEDSEVISGGVDVADTSDDDDNSLQKLLKTDDYVIVTYKDNEIFLDNVIMKEVQKFLTIATRKNKKHKVFISAYDIKGQVSATITKQISLARSLGTRNLIRKMGYEKKDVRIDLSNKFKVKEKINTQNGYLIIRVKK